jgi:hypothetical protein
LRNHKPIAWKRQKTLQPIEERRQQFSKANRRKKNNSLEPKGERRQQYSGADRREKTTIFGIL